MQDSITGFRVNSFLFCFLINSMFLEVEPSETLKLVDKNNTDWFLEGPVIKQIINTVK